MWMNGSVELERLMEYRRGAGNWQSVSGTWGPTTTLEIEPMLFLYAAMRGAARGEPPGWRAVSFGFYSALAAMSYLQRGIYGSSTLSLHADIQQAKDFLGSGTKGTIGAAVALLEARAQGYSWGGHWEDAFSLTGKSPDYVLFRNTEMLILEAKGTEQNNPARGKWLKSEWLGQVEPHVVWTGADESWLVACCLSQIGSSSLERVLSPPLIAAGSLPPNQLTLLQKIMITIRSIGRWLGWPLPTEVTELAPLRDFFQTQTPTKKFNLLLGPTVTAHLGDFGPFTAVPFCRFDVLANLFHLAASPRGNSMPEPPRNEYFEIYGEDIAIAWTDGTGLLLKSAPGGPSLASQLL